LYLLIKAKRFRLRMLLLSQPAQYHGVVAIWKPFVARVKFFSGKLISILPEQQRG
jgi:hypothetical protein